MHPLKHTPISLEQARDALSPIYQHMQASPLLSCQALSQQLDCELYIKHENHNPTGSFKIRGGINLMHHLAKTNARGVITFSTGNHGLSVAQSAAWFGLPATIVVPEGNNPAKNRRIKATGANLLEAGSSFEHAAQTAERLCNEQGLYYAHPADEPCLINGVASEFLEILEQLPDIDALILPIGAGSELAAATLVLKQLKPEVEIFAVQAESSPAAYLSWRAGRIQSADNRTFAGGFATGSGYALPFSYYRESLSDFVLLSEQEIYQGIALAAHYTQNLMEGAGSASLMAALRLRERLKGKKVVVQFSGANASASELRHAYQLPCFEHGLNAL
ncbi:threonine ammonia-lyase [Aliagarivorans marinus]|uniref:threonine ammonia-lyase n=1 Tax=Aliagarivorans marinus TaxID=561965 RepID=UPI000428F57D|nr:threonine/serine dehydratase [Aliagarivorans marinus]